MPGKGVFSIVVFTASACSCAVSPFCPKAEIVREKTGAEPDAQTQFSIRLYCYGTLGMTREWLMNDNITPAETVVRMMFGSMPESLR